MTNKIFIDENVKEVRSSQNKGTVPLNHIVYCIIIRLTVKRIYIYIDILFDKNKDL